MICIVLCALWMKDFLVKVPHLNPFCFACASEVDDVLAACGVHAWDGT